MKKKTDRELINNILERLRLLENWCHRIEHEKNVFEMGHRISRILCDKGDKFDLELLAKLQVLLGTDLIEVKSVKRNKRY